MCWFSAEMLCDASPGKELCSTKETTKPRIIYMLLYYKDNKADVFFVIDEEYVGVVKWSDVFSTTPPKRFCSSSEFKRYIWLS